MKVFTGYILKQFYTYTALSLMLFIFILMMDRIFNLVSLLVNKGLDISVAGTLLFYSLPTMIVLSMPMSVLSGGILTFGKMASDGEITVIRTSGNPLKPLVLPVLISITLLTVLMVPFNYYVAPTFQEKFRNLFFDVAFKNPALRLEESTLIEIPPYTLLCLNVDHKKKLIKEIIIHKKAEENEPAVTITARNGTWGTNSAGDLVLVLNDGNLRYQSDQSPEKLSSIKFNEYQITMLSQKNVKSVNKSIDSMTGKQLKGEIKRLKEKNLPTYKISTRYYLRGALVGAIPVLLVIGIPLGIRAERKGKTIGIGMSIAVIAIYYFLMVTGVKLAFNKSIIPWLGVWMPNFLVGSAGIVMLFKSYYK